LNFSSWELLLLVGDYPIRQLVLCEKDFGWMTLGVEPTSVGNALADGLCDLGAKSLRLKASIIEEGGQCPF
jgi:hypothetical protein